RTRQTHATHLAHASPSHSSKPPYGTTPSRLTNLARTHNDRTNTRPAHRAPTCTRHLSPATHPAAALLRPKSRANNPRCRSARVQIHLPDPPHALRRQIPPAQTLPTPHARQAAHKSAPSRRGTELGAVSEGGGEGARYISAGCGGRVDCYGVGWGPDGSGVLDGWAHRRERGGGEEDERGMLELM
ncbi:hypothetical protein JI435_104390, partial [Parastagonospora nodorum SN15]